MARELSEGSERMQEELLVTGQLVTQVRVRAWPAMWLSQPLTFNDMQLYVPKHYCAATREIIIFLTLPAQAGLWAA